MRRIVLGLAPLAAVALAACGSSKPVVVTVAPSSTAAAASSTAAPSTPASSTASSTAASSATPAAAASDTDLPDPAVLASIFPSYIQRHISTLENTSDDSLSQLGHAVCSDFEKGNTFQETAQDVIDSLHLSEYEGGFFLGASVAAYCPQFKNKIPGS